MIKEELQPYIYDSGLTFDDNQLNKFDYEVPTIPYIEPFPIPGYEETEEQKESIKKYFEDMKKGIEKPVLVPEVIIEQKPSIHDEYQHYIDQIPNGKIDISYGDMITILRWIEKKLGNGDIPMNFSCESCIVSLVQLFSDLKNK